MSKAPEDGDKFNETLKRMLKTPPTPHKPARKSEKATGKLKPATRVTHKPPARKSDA